MKRKSYSRFAVAILAAGGLTFTTACDQALTAPGETSLVPADAALAGIGDTGNAIGEINDVTPSTNEANKAAGWAYVAWNSDDAGVGEAPLKFVSTRTFYSCFEYRIDGEPPTGDPHPNTEIQDGLWEYTCVNDSEATVDLVAESYVDVRMVFGAEGDERFDWTRFYVMTALSKDDCKDGGWQAQGFTNQGRCIRYVETGKDSRSTGVFGAVTWTSALGAEGLLTEFAVNAATETGSVRFLNETAGSFTMTVACAAVIGNEAWAGGTISEADGAYEDWIGGTYLFYAEDNEALGTADKIGGWNQKSCADGFKTWQGGGTVTDGDLVVR